MYVRPAWRLIPLTTCLRALLEVVCSLQITVNCGVWTLNSWNIMVEQLTLVPEATGAAAPLGSRDILDLKHNDVI